MRKCQRTRSRRIVGDMRETYSGVNCVARTVMLVEARKVAGDLGRINSRGLVVTNAR